MEEVGVYFFDILLGVVMTLFAVLGFLAKRELSTNDRRIATVESKVSMIDKTLAVFEREMRIESKRTADAAIRMDARVREMSESFKSLEDRLDDKLDELARGVQHIEVEIAKVKK